MDSVNDRRIEKHFFSVGEVQEAGWVVNWYADIERPNEDGEFWTWCHRSSHNGPDHVGRVLIGVSMDHPLLKAADAWADSTGLQLVEVPVLNEDRSIEHAEADLGLATADAQQSFWMALAKWRRDRHVGRKVEV